MVKNLSLCLANAFSTDLVIAILLSTTLIGSVAQATEPMSFNPTASAHIRTLAASCAACHGTNGNSVAANNIANNKDVTLHLAGVDPAYFTTQMFAFKNGTRKATVMHHHAKGLTIDEINLLAIYFSQQKKVLSISPTSQLLKVDRD